MSGGPAKHSTLFLRGYTWLATHILARFPSLVVEAASGVLAVVLVVGALTLLRPGPASVAVLATALSVAYEARLDPNGFSWRDCAERELGILVAVLVWAIL